MYFHDPTSIPDLLAGFQNTNLIDIFPVTWFMMGGRASVLDKFCFILFSITLPIIGVDPYIIPHFYSSYWYTTAWRESIISALSHLCLILQPLQWFWYWFTNIIYIYIVYSPKSHISIFLSSQSTKSHTHKNRFASDLTLNSQSDFKET